MNKSEVYAKHIKAKTSSKKVVPVMDLIRGKPLHDAKVILTFDRTKPAKLILKILKSAEANARNNNKLDTSKMYVSEAWVGEGPVSKWGSFKGRGRFSPILKRTANLIVGISTVPEKKVKTKGGKK